MIDKLQELVNKCKGSVTVSFNPQRERGDCSTQDIIDERLCSCGGGIISPLSEETKKIMDDTSSTIEIRFRPFDFDFSKECESNYVLVYHHGNCLDNALDMALSYIPKNKEKK